jgi:DNA helicase-2/ATP-dependent DNA helicase PcrA
MLSIKLDYKELYKGIFKSTHFSNLYGRVLDDKEINSFVNKDILNYEDSLLMIYMIGLIEGFPYNNRIKQVVIDEAQDYSYLQYFIIKKIFGNASFTILGDVNQTINPYYKYDSLSILENLLNGKTRYIELTKTYRSSEEIINYTNKILGLQFVSAIRKKNNVPVIIKEEDNIKEQLINDINELKSKYKSVAIITKTDTEAEYLYKLLNMEEINLLKATSENFNRDLVIVPSYVSKGLEFDAVISYTDKNNKYRDDEKYLYYVVCKRAQH